MDRFKEPNEPKSLARCSHCNGEIYAGDEIYEINDGIGLGAGFVHDNGVCAEDWAVEQLYERRGFMAKDGGIE